MKKLFLLALLAVSVFAQSYGTGPSITWYTDSAHTQPARGGMENQKLYGVLSSAATAAAMYGHSVGSVTLTDSTHVTYTPPAIITPAHSVNGLQPLPNDDIFFTRIDALPLRSDQGSPTAGTGQYTPLEPTAAFLSANSYPSCSPSTPGSTNAATNGGGCHIQMADSGNSASPTTTATVLRNPVPPSTWHMTSANGYGVGATVVFPTGSQPDVRGTFYENRQGGNYHIPGQVCNISGTEAPSPAFSYCNSGYGGTGDMHEFQVDPINLTNYESYNDTDRANVYIDCIKANPPSRSCTLSSWRHIDWSTYAVVGGMGVAGTPENQLELTSLDLYLAHDGLPIAHTLVYPMEPGYQYLGHRWPALGQNEGSSTDTYGRQMGSRMRFTSSRFNITGVSNVTVGNAGAGYTPGSYLPITITGSNGGGCTSIDGTNPAQGLAFIGTNGQIANYNSHFYAAITNTGKNCTGALTASLPAPPAGGTQASVTVAANFPGGPNNAWQDANTGAQIVAQAQQYGWELDDNGPGPQARTDATVTRNPYWGTFSQFVSGNGGTSWNGYTNPFLWEEVDESSLETTAWGSTAGPNLWIADSANTYEGAYVNNQAVVKLTASGGTSYTPIPLLGVSVGFVVGNQPDRVNIISGMAAFSLAAHAYVTGDPTNAGMTWSIMTDPCSGDASENLTTAGLYTPCSQFNGATVMHGLFKVVSNANPNAYDYVDVYVLPTDGLGNVRIDSGGSGGCTGTSVSGSTCNGGVWYAADSAEQMLDYRKDTSNCDYPTWATPSLPIPTAPNATLGELKSATGVCVYQTSIADNDVTYTVVVPNGNYQVRSMFARAGNGSNGAAPSNAPFARSGGYGPTVAPYPGWDWLFNLDTQGAMKLYSYCFLCLDNDMANTPVDVNVPAKVTDNVLEFGVRGVYMNRYYTTSAQDSGPHDGQQAIIAGVNFLLDTATTPHWDVHMYTPNDDVNAMDANYTWIVPINNGNTSTTSGAIPPGVYQLYIEDWYTGVNDPTWSIVAGPGTISATGLFVAPTTQPTPGGTCTTVKAQSQSSSYLATRNICYSGAPSYQFH